MINFNDPQVFLPLSAVTIFLVMYFAPQVRAFFTNDDRKQYTRCFVLAALAALVGIPATICSSIWLSYVPDLLSKIMAGGLLGVAIVTDVVALVVFCIGIEHQDKGR